MPKILLLQRATLVKVINEVNKMEDVVKAGKVFEVCFYKAVKNHNYCMFQTLREVAQVDTEKLTSSFVAETEAHFKTVSKMNETKDESFSPSKFPSPLRARSPKRGPTLSEKSVPSPLQPVRMPAAVEDHDGFTEIFGSSSS